MGYGGTVVEQQADPSFASTVTRRDIDGCGTGCVRYGVPLDGQDHTPNDKKKTTGHNTPPSPLT